MNVVIGNFSGERRREPEGAGKRIHRVSRLSDFDDDEWRIETTTGGVRTVITLQWDLEPPRGRGLEPDEWIGLLRQSKRLVASLLTVRTNGHKLKPESLPQVYYPLLFLLRWLFTQGIPSLIDITPSVARRFVAHLESEKVTDAEEPVKHDTITAYLRVITHVYDQQLFVLHYAGEDLDKPSRSMTRHPFDGLKASKVAASIVDRKDRGWIPPVPDEVWLPVVRTAMAWLDAPADHLVLFGRVLADWLAGAVPAPEHGQDLWAAVRASDDDGALTEWLVAEAAIQFPDATAEDCLRNRPLMRLYRILLKDLRDACTIVFQAMLGLRVGELAGLVSFPAHKGGAWPYCVLVERSRTGLNEIFTIQGFLYKGQRRPAPTTWIAGTRPVGTAHVPLAVKAVIAMDRAFRPWRITQQVEKLVVPMSSVPGGHSGSRSLDEILSSDINAGQKDFVRRRVTLPPSHPEFKLSTHRWRKSFAIHMVRADESLLGPVSDHFKHLNAAATEQGYVGRDTEMLGYLDDAGLDEMAWNIHEAINGKAKIAGPMAEAILDRASQINAVAGPDASPEDRLHRLKKMLKDDGVRVATAGWGRCVFRPEVAQCRPAAQNPARRRIDRPDYANRQPGLCCTCANLLITDGHADFWRDRLRENLEIRRDARASGDQASVTVATTRARQSLKVLRKLKMTAAKQKEYDHAAA